MDNAITRQLDALADLREKIAGIRARHQKKRDALLKPIKAKLEVTVVAEAQDVADLLSQEEKLTADVKSAVIAAGESTKATRLHAVLTSGREKWDGSKLEGMAVALPQILEARTIGEPSVALRAVKA